MTTFPKPRRVYRDYDYKYHLVLSFEDQGETYYVVRYYGKHKQWWHYEIWDSRTMAFNKENGYKIVKHRNTKEIVL